MKEARRTKKALWPILIGTTIVVILLSLEIGRYSVALHDLPRMLLAPIFGWTDAGSAQDATMLLQIRLPRVICALVVGGALSVSGCTFQGLYKNAMASPDLLGATSGAGSGAALAVVLRLPLFGVQAAAFGMSLLAVVLTILVSRGIRRKADIALTTILVGIVIGVLFTTLLQLVQMTSNPSETMQRIRFWLTGSFAVVTWQSFLVLLPFFFVGLLPILLLRWRLNVLAFGDEEAKTLGMNVSLIRGIFVACASLLTACTVAICGIVGWVGLIVPHVTRFFAGQDFKRLIPASFFTGAIFLMLVDDAARSIFAFELPIGMLTSLIGMAFYIGLVLFKRRAVL